MSSHVAGMDALEPRQMMFAQAIADDAGTIKRSVAMTDAAVYFQMQPTSLANTEASDTRKYVRLSRGTNQLETITPAKGTWDLSNLEFARALGGDTVLLHFDDGSMWSIRDGSKKAEKLIDIERIDYEGAAAIGHTLYFQGRGERGSELYSTDGTAKGTRALPELRTTGDGDANPYYLTPFGSQLLLTARTDAKPDRQFLRWDGKAFRNVEAIKGDASDIAVADGKVVVVVDGKLSTLSKDLKTATPFASSRATAVDHLTTLGKDVAFLSAGGVYRSDLTTKGTIRLDDKPIEHSDGYTTRIEIDASGYLLHAYNGGQVLTSGGSLNFGGTPQPSPTPPAVYRLEAKSMTKVLDGSYSKVARLGDATYFVAGTGYAAGGTVVRMNKDGSTATIDVGANGARTAFDARSLVFAAGTTLYLVDPASTLGAIHGGLFSDDNLNRKYNGSDDAIGGTNVFVDYDRDGRRDDNEPTASVQYGSFTFTAVRPGTFDLRADVGGNYRGGVAVGRVTVKAREVAEAKLLATPLFSTIRVDVFTDANANGVRDKTETPAAGYKAYLDLDGDKKLDTNEPTAITDANGVATFTGLRPQRYNVRVKSLRADDLFTTPTYANLRTTADGTSVVSVGVRQDPKNGSIRGQLEAAHYTKGFGDVQVGLYRDGVLVAQTDASNAGRFNFSGLARGTYVPKVIAAGRYEAATGASIAVEPDVTAKTTLDFAISQVVYGVAFYDENGNGLRDAGERTLANAEVYVSRQGLSITDPVTTRTDAAGRYETFVRYGAAFSSDVFYVYADGDPATSDLYRSTGGDIGVGLEGEPFSARVEVDLPLR